MEAVLRMAWRIGIVLNEAIDVQTEPRATTEPDESDVATAMSLLREEAVLYDSLEELARRQRDYVACDDATRLLTVLVDRRKLSDDLQRVGKRLSPMRSSWDAYRKRLSESQRSEVEGLIGKTAECVKRIMKRDEEDVRVLSARKEMVAVGLRATHVSGEALAAYGAPGMDRCRPGSLDEAS